MGIGLPWRMWLTALAALSLLVSTLISPVHAKTTAKASIKGTRVVVVFKGKAPAKAKLKVAGASYRLTKKTKKIWRTKKLTTAQLTAIAGGKAKIKARVKGKNLVVKTTVTGAPPAPSADDPTAPAPPADPAPVTPPPPAGLFDAPGVDRTGNDAWNAIQGYFLDSTFTNCPGGWSTCGAEERYGHFADYTTVYCRLSAIGGDITNYPKEMKIIGAEQKADGSWGVSYNFYYGDGRSRIYSWYIQPNGSVSGRYFLDGALNEEMTGFYWLRGAKDCSY